MGGERGRGEVGRDNRGKGRNEEKSRGGGKLGKCKEVKWREGKRDGMRRNGYRRWKEVKR